MTARAETPEPAQGSDDTAGYVIPIVAAGVALAVIVAVAVHYSKKRSITGCVASGPSGMTITDEKDQKVYALPGDTPFLKPGERMKLQGKKVKSKGAGKSLAWQTRVAKDLGVCPAHP